MCWAACRWKKGGNTESELRTEMWVTSKSAASLSKLHSVRRGGVPPSSTHSQLTVSPVPLLTRGLCVCLRVALRASDRPAQCCHSTSSSQHPHTKHNARSPSLSLCSPWLSVSGGAVAATVQNTATSGSHDNVIQTLILDNTEKLQELSLRRWCSLFNLIKGQKIVKTCLNLPDTISTV